MTGKYSEADRRHRYIFQSGNWNIITRNIMCAVKCEMTVPTKNNTINVLYRVRFRYLPKLVFLEEVSRRKEKWLNYYEEAIPTNYSVQGREKVDMA